MAVSTEAAAAALARAEKEAERKREAKAKDERAREAAKRAEEEEILAMKQEAAAASERLERAEAIKSSAVKEAAKRAAVERAIIAEQEYQVHERNITEDMDAASKNVPEKSAVGNMNTSRHSEAGIDGSIDEKMRDKEARARAQNARDRARKAEEEKLEAKHRAAAEAGEALEKSEQLKSAKAREAARLAAEERAKGFEKQQNNRKTAAASSQSETPKREASKATSEQRYLRENDGEESSHGVNMKRGNVREETFTPTQNSHKTVAEEKMSVGGKNAEYTMVGSREEKVNYRRSNNTNHCVIQEKPVQPENQGRQMIYADSKDVCVHQSSTRPKERMSEQSKHTQSNQSMQCEEDQNTNVAVQKEKSRYSPEKEIVSITGESRTTCECMGQYRRQGNYPEKKDTHTPEKEIVSITGDENGNKSRLGRNKVASQCDGQNSPSRKNNTRRGSEQQYRGSSQSEHYPGNVDNYHHKPRNQSYNGSPAKKTKGFESHHHDHHRHQQQQDQYSHNKQLHHKSPHRQVQQQQQHQGSPAQGVSMKLICGGCNEKYNLREKMPRILFCGHSICTPCIRKRTNPDYSVTCTRCPVETWCVWKAHHCPIDVDLKRLLLKETQQEESKYKDQPHSFTGSDSKQPRLQHDRVRSGSMQAIVKSEAGHHTAGVKSPHGSRCLEMLVRPSHYCLACRVWVCTKCVEAEHRSKKCSLKPLKQQLADMKQLHVHAGQDMQELLRISLQDLENDCNEEEVLQLWLKTSVKYVEKKKEIMKKSLQEGKEIMDALTGVMESMPSAHNLPEALSMFQMLEDITDNANQWSESTEGSAAGADKERTACLKYLLKKTLKLTPVVNGKALICAADKTPDAELHSELTVVGGKFHVHALRKRRPTEQEATVLPVQCFKSSQDTASALLFLDLSWGGQCRGRVYIRLIGDTLRGRHLINLCSGEGGVSFCGTRFHRIIGKGLPGEHMWTGDYQYGDGSGGEAPKASSTPTNSLPHLPAGQEMPIMPGLVAGRCEKKASTIFRIYTRGDTEAKDEAGFGNVEGGLEVLREAVRLRVITEVVISDCGFVLEV